MTPNCAVERSPMTARLDMDSAMHSVWRLHLIFRPSDGWVAMAMLTLNLMIVVWSVGTAEWVDTPNLVSLILYAMITGLVLSRIPIWGILLLPIGVAAGVLIIVWKLVGFESETVVLVDSAELWERLSLWMQAAQSGSINIDTVPFAFALMAATWLAGFFGVWLFARHGNFWGVFILGGAGLLSNLTYLPPNASVHLGFYMFTALLLVARVQSVRRRNQWRERNVGFDGHLGILSLSDSFIMGLVVVVVAFLMIPLGGKWQPTNDAYELLRTPMKGWEDDFNRLFAGLPARRALGYRIWGDVMPFQGTINPTEVPVLQVESRLPMYWKARTYNTYTPKGWVSEDTGFQPIGWAPEYTNAKAYRDQFEISYVVVPNYETQQLFGSGQVTAASREIHIETYDSPYYAVNLTGPESYLGVPPKLEEAARRLNQVISIGGGSASDASLALGLPTEFRLVEVSREGGAPAQAIIAEAIPPRADVVSVRSAKGRVKPGHAYQLTSRVSLANPTQLQQAGEDYPTWALVKYTQLPDSLPQRVRDKAAQIADSATTPYDKAQAIESYLRTLPYTLEVDPPPFNADGVDHFLFTLGKGYSEYFSSAMTVMLRSQGIPARMVTGYTSGDKVEGKDSYIVTDADSHGWVEVFFPEYGWIPFEPTPGEKLPLSYIPAPLEEEKDATSGVADEDIDDDCEADLEDCELGARAPDVDGVFAGRFFLNNSLRDMLPMLMAILAAVILTSGTIKVLWWRFMQPSVNPEILYRRLGFLGALNSVGPVRHQTPFQFRMRLEEVLPSQRENLSTVVGCYVRSRYGRKTVSEAEQAEIVQAWIKLRIPLLLNALRRRT